MNGIVIAVVSGCIGFVLGGGTLIVYGVWIMWKDDHSDDIW